MEVVTEEVGNQMTDCPKESLVREVPSQQSCQGSEGEIDGLKIAPMYCNTSRRVMEVGAPGLHHKERGMEAMKLSAIRIDSCGVATDQCPLAKTGGMV